MKSKKLLFSSLLMLGGIATYITMSSNSGGKMGVSTTGCGGGGCHGAASTNTTITLLSTPLMTNGYTPGTVYTMTLGITNMAKSKSGFDLSVTGGTLGGNQSGTMLMGTELHHTSPMTAVSGISGTQFTWTAPTTASADFRIAVNAVNGDNGTSGDEWAMKTVTFNKAIPAGINDIEKTSVTIYPNPASDYITIKTTSEIKTVKAVSLTGSLINLTASKVSNDEYRIETKTLATGAYMLLMNDGSKTIHSKFIKQ